MNAITNYQRETHLMTVSRNDGKLFTEFIEEYINKCHRTDLYKQMYRIASNHITAFSCKVKLAIYTDSLSEETLEEFVFYLQDDRKLMISTVKGIVERVKSMLQKASNAGYKVDGTFRDFNVQMKRLTLFFFL